MSMQVNRKKGEDRLLQPTYNDGRVKQSFKDETDINKILKRAQKTGTISHLAKHQAKYGDFADFDFFGNMQMIAKGREIFDDLPSEIRSEFHQSQTEFFDYVNDPENKDRLEKLLPGLVAPGRENINPQGGVTADEAKAALDGEKENKEGEAKPEAKETPDASKEAGTPPSSPST